MRAIGELDYDNARIVAGRGLGLADTATRDSVAIEYLKDEGERVAKSIEVKSANP